MRKVNRILMATVAVLLSLVLISTSIVSGIFAKYVITKQATVTMEIEKFGVTIALKADEGGYLAAAGATVTPVKIGNDTISVSITGLQMGPGDKFFDALNVQITGTPNTKVKLKTTYKVDYDYQNAYKIPQSYSGQAEDSYLPIGFTLRVPNGNNVDVCYPWTAGIENKVEEVIMRNTSETLFAVDIKTASSINTDDDFDYSYEKSYTAGTAIESVNANLTNFYMGLYLPSANETLKNSKKVDVNVDSAWMYLLEHAANSNITIKYTFHIEQAD